MFWGLVGAWVYFANYYEPPDCFDLTKNGDELGVDCGGSCVRICAADVLPPRVVWAKSFEVKDGQYNAVAYVENPNQSAASPEVHYTFKLLNDGVTFAERSGTTVLPPNSVYPIFEGKIMVESDEEITETNLIIEPVEMWLPASVNRDQFRSADINLSAAGSDHPRLDVEIENTDLSSSDNVEVVVTVFNDEGEPVTASQTLIERIEARSTKDIVFTWPSQIANTIRSCIIPTDVAVVIDLSGSMNNDGGDPPQPITDALAAAGQFVNGFKEKDQVAVVTFATEATLVTELTGLHSAVADSILNLGIDPVEESGYTNTVDALLVAQAELDSGRHNEDARRVLVLLTDGLPTVNGDEDVVMEAEVVAGRLSDDTIEVYAIGLGDGVDYDFIKNIATSADKAYVAPSADDLQKIYSEITSSLCVVGPTKIDVIAKTKPNFAPLR